MSISVDSQYLQAAYTIPNHWMGLQDDMEQHLISDDDSDTDSHSGSGTESNDDGRKIAAGGDVSITNIKTTGHIRIGYQQTPSTDSTATLSNERAYIDPQILMNSLDDIKTMLISRYMHLELPRVPWMKDLVLPMEEYYFDLTVCQNDKSNTNQPISIKNIFQPVLPNRPPYRILIEGGPGSGKSTLARKLAFDWARCESYIGMFELVFVLDLRDMDMGLDAILQEYGRVYGMDGNLVLTTIEKYVDKVLLILDGFDEVPQEARKYIIPLLCSKQYPRMTVVATSKPSTANRDFYLHKILTIQGFTEKQQKSFLQKYLSPEHNYCVLQENLTGIVTNHNKELFNCPIFLLLLASFASESDSKVIWTKTILYKQLFNFLVRQRLYKIKSPDLCDLFYKSLHDASGNFSTSMKDVSGNISALLKFGKLALSTLQTGVLFFTKEDILHCCGDEKILAYGFLKQDLIIKKRRFKEIFEPLHKSLVEFLAGLYLSNLARTDWHHFMKEMQTLKSSYDKYSMIIDFTAGLLDYSGHKVFTALTSNSFLDIGTLQNFRSTLSECDITEDLLKALTPLMPQIWQIPEKSLESYSSTFQGTSIHCAAVRHGIIVNHIKAVVCEALEFSSCNLPKDIEIPYLHLTFKNPKETKHSCEESRLSNFDAKGQKCHQLLCSIKSMTAGSPEEIQKLFDIISTIKATKVCFELNDTVSGQILPIILGCFAGYKLYGLYNATMVLSKEKSCRLCNINLITDLILTKKIEELSLSLVRINTDIAMKNGSFQIANENDSDNDLDDGIVRRFWNLFRNVKPRLMQLHPPEEEEIEYEPAFVSFGRALFSSQCYIRKLVIASYGFDPEETRILSLCVRRSLRIQEMYVCTNGNVPAYFDLNILCFEGSKTWKCLAFSNVRLELGQRPKEPYSIKELHLLAGKDLGTCAEALTCCIIEKLVCNVELLVEMFKLAVQNVNDYLTVRYFQLLTETRQWHMFAGLEELSLNIATEIPGSIIYEKVLCAIMSANLKRLEIQGWIENVPLVSQTFDFIQKQYCSFQQTPETGSKSDPHVPTINLELLSLHSTRFLLPECIPKNVLLASKLKSLLLTGHIKLFKMAMYCGVPQHLPALQLAEALKSPFSEEEGFQISVHQEILFDWEKKHVCPLSKNIYTIVTVCHR